MASRLFAAAAAAATSSPLPLARRITSRGVPGPQGRHWYSEKANLWEDPRNPMRWKNSHDCRHFSTDVRKPAGKAGSGMRIWWHRATYPIHRIKNHMGMQERAMARFVLLVFGAGTPTVLWVKKVRDVCY